MAENELKVLSAEVYLNLNWADELEKSLSYSNCHLNRVLGALKSNNTLPTEQIADDGYFRFVNKEKVFSSSSNFGVYDHHIL